MNVISRDVTGTDLYNVHGQASLAFRHAVCCGTNLGRVFTLVAEETKMADAQVEHKCVDLQLLSTQRRVFSAVV